MTAPFAAQPPDQDAAMRERVRRRIALMLGVEGTGPDPSIPDPAPLPDAPPPIPTNFGQRLKAFIHNKGSDIAAGLRGFDPNIGGFQGGLGSAGDAYGRVEGLREQLEDRRARRANEAQRAQATSDVGRARELEGLAQLYNALEPPKPTAIPKPGAIDPRSKEGIAAELETYRGKKELDKKYPSPKTTTGRGKSGQLDDINDVLNQLNKSVDDTRAELADAEREPQPVLDPALNAGVTRADSAQVEAHSSRLASLRERLAGLTATTDSVAAEQRAEVSGRRPSRIATPAKKVGSKVDPRYKQRYDYLEAKWKQARQRDPKRADALFQQAVGDLNKQFGLP